MMSAWADPAAPLPGKDLQCDDGASRQRAGSSRLALLEMESAQRKAPQFRSDPVWELRRAGVLLDAGHHDRALALLRELESISVLRNSELAAGYFNDYGRALAASGNLTEAIVRFDLAAETARTDSDSELLGRALLNGLRARIDARELSGFDAHLEKVLTTVGSAQSDSLVLLQLAELVHRAVQELALPETLLDAADALTGQALEAAGSKSDDRMLSAQIAGVRGEIAETRGDLSLAAELTKLAVLHAEAGGSVSQVFRWQWQRARLARTQGDDADALAALREAVFLLEEFRSAVVPAGGDSYRTLVDPVYRTYADLLLLDSSKLSGAAQQLELRHVRGLLESLKTAEVEDYFANSCLASEALVESEIPEGQAVLYPLLFADRLELLLEVNGQLLRTSVSIDRASVVREVRAFRLNLERPESRDDYLLQSQQLYRWLISPIHETLVSAKVDTLILVPDGALRTIPFAALHNDDEFLVEQYALATTPAVGLTKDGGKSFIGGNNSNNGSILAGGLTQSVQGFSALPGVGIEMSALVGQYGAREMRDEEFRLESVSNGLISPDYGVVHLATHGEFSADHRDSFLLTFDDRLRLPALKTLLDGRANTQLDLLVLSACQTAAGDDEAALGLAGIAVQSGARSAVASLWSISDTSTAELFGVFYAELRKGGVNKAESLQRAQLSLLRNEQFSHPSYWAPYLLIGRVI